MGTRIQHANIYVNSVKVGVANKISYEKTPGDEMQFGAEGYIGHSDGADTTKITMNTITPVTGETKSLKKLCDQKLYCTIALSNLDGDVEQIEMRCTGAKYDSDAKTGALEGTFNFEGGRSKTL